MAKTSATKLGREAGEPGPRERIVDAAFAAFVQYGYANASTLEIATRARVSKRELYTLVGNKQRLLMACISERAKRFKVPSGVPELRNRESLAEVLASLGATLVREISDPDVIAVFRLAIAEVAHAPEVARALDSIGRETSRKALREVMAGAKASGVLTGHPAELAEQYAALLWRDLLMSLLLGVVKPPNVRQIAERARNAVTDFLQLHPAPAST